MTFVSEPGMYKIIFRCREAGIPGTAPFAFTEWICYDVLPAIRRTQRYEIRQSIMEEFDEEKGRRLWNVVKTMDLWSYNARRRWFGRVCRDTAHLCSLDRFKSPHIIPGRLAAVQDIIRATMNAAIVDAVPNDQSLITQYFG